MRRFEPARRLPFTSSWVMFGSMLWGRTGDLRFAGGFDAAFFRKSQSQARPQTASDPRPFSAEELIRRAIPRTLLEGVLAAHGNVVLA